MPKKQIASAKPLFNLDFLQSLVQDETACVHLHTYTHHLALHPYHLNNLTSSIQELLNDRLSKYNSEMEGIVCGYNNIKLLSQLGQIIEDSCFIHIDIQAEFFLFKPVIGNSLRGVVKKKAKDHVGCLVHNLFNVSVPRPKRAAEWLGEAIEVGNEVNLIITSASFEGRLPYIKGEIVEVLTQDEPEQKISFEESPKKGKKRKFDMDETVEEAPTKKKKRKSMIVKEEPEVFDEEAVTETPVKKKKKRKSVNLDDSIEEDPCESPVKKRKNKE